MFKAKHIDITLHFLISVSMTNFRLQSTFIQKTVDLFREKFVAKYPEWRLPTPKTSLTQSSSSRTPSNDNVIVYTADISNGHFAKVLIKKILNNGKVEFEERNCSEEPKYVKELQELVGDDKMIRFPMVIVNGRDFFCGEDEIQGLEDFEGRVRLKSALNIMYASQMRVESMNTYMKAAGSIIGWK